jgi:PKD repeat protein
VLTTHRAVAIEATAQDQDPGDAVVGWRWTVTRLSAACDADVDQGAAATLEVAFWCAGTYEVTLVVTDTVGSDSLPVRKTVTVSASTSAPTIAVGADVSVEHRCAGAPIRCQLEQEVTLSASGLSALGGPLSFRWSAVPPDLRRAAAAVRFSPSAEVAAPVLAIETDGGPISGAWALRVRARDEAGNLAQATQRVAVGNRAPVLDPAPLQLDHRYGDGVFKADGTLTVPLSDPDGDPLEVSVQLVEPAGTGCSAAFTEVAAGRGSFSLSCPGPTGLRASGRVLRAVAADTNDAVTTADARVEVGNRLPVIRPRAGASVTELTLDHTVGPCPGGAGRCFLATGQDAFEVFDPDGDPLTDVTLVAGVDPSRPGSTGEVGAGTAAGQYRFSTPISRPWEFRDATGASGFWLGASVADPFGAAAAPPLSIRITNRPPVLKTAPYETQSHRYEAATHQYLAGGVVATYEDPDGDPLVDTGSYGDPACSPVGPVDGVLSATCTRTYDPASGALPSMISFIGSHQLHASISDGWESVAAGPGLIIANQPPVIPPFNGPIESCTCVCERFDDAGGGCLVSKWRLQPTAVPVPPRPTDADGDPLHVTYLTSANLSVTAVTALPAACGTAIMSGGSYPLTIQVSANDGQAQASATWTVTAIQCSRSGSSCAY